MLGGCHSYLGQRVVVRARVEGRKSRGDEKGGGATHDERWKERRQRQVQGVLAYVLRVLTNHLLPRIVPTRHI